MGTGAIGVLTSELDEAFEQLGRLDFELPNGFVNHGPMACEALATLGFEGEIGPWVRRFEFLVGPGPQPVRPTSTGEFVTHDALGEYARLPEWIGFFDEVIQADGWSQVIGEWVPVLMPALATALFHGVIRTAHAVRAVGAVDSAPRQRELARALGYWAARYQQGSSVDLNEAGAAVEEAPAAAPGAARTVGAAVLGAGGAASVQFAVGPDILTLHCVTGAMAVHLLLPHLAEPAQLAARRQIAADHAAFGIIDGAVIEPGERTARGEATSVAGWDRSLDAVAGASRDVHQIKLVEACRRGFAASGIEPFLAAARTSGFRSLGG